MWNRYKHEAAKTLRQLHPDTRKFYGYNFRYLKFRDAETKARLMESARFQILPYPDPSEIDIWDDTGKHYTLEEANRLPIIKLPTRAAVVQDPSIPLTPQGR